MQLAVIPLLFVFATAAGSAAGDVQRAALDQEFEIKVGEKVLIERADLLVRFERVAEDSRCPRNVKCVWAGNGKVVLKLSKAKRGHATMNLNTTLDPKHDLYQRYDVKLIRLDPYPEKDVQIKMGDYVATLVVTRK
ncbi:MAG TPA: hypothetical protein VF791_06545 [Pyrinomonadaceae bacterium]